MCVYIHRYVYTYTCGCVSSRRHLYILNTTSLHLTLTCLHQQFVDVYKLKTNVKILACLCTFCPFLHV